MAAAALSATFNAFAFAGAGFLFSKIDKGNYQEEVKRHNLAMEKLTKARDVWNQNRLKELDRLQQLQYAKEEGKKDLRDTDVDLDEVQTYGLSKFEEEDFLKKHPQPQLTDYYKPSPKMSKYMTDVKYAVSIPAMYGLLSFVL